ncbi:MAG: BMP family ABC transporter substrate-binding protein, partial [Oscillospiraceae bacterium]|nr:BMP family ABC transporter substrate-binding protein [Oscillospiraceae bacterium]
MNIVEAREEYTRALKSGQREMRDLLNEGVFPHPAVLDDILPAADIDSIINVGTVDVPMGRIVGTKTSGRVTAFTKTFLPLLGIESEFAYKWMSLCAAHLSDEGIREPIVCYEYMGNFYVQEGNKRVSVLRHFEAPAIPGNVFRVMPQPSDDPAVKVSYEFL